MEPQRPDGLALVGTAGIEIGARSRAWISSSVLSEHKKEMLTLALP